MEVVQYFLNRYHKAMEALNVLPPSIEPHASGHIIEQIYRLCDFTFMMRENQVHCSSVDIEVLYVRNITDVGHLEHDADDGEDKIAKKARLEQLEPMEVVQYFLNRYHKAMEYAPYL